MTGLARYARPISHLAFAAALPFLGIACDAGSEPAADDTTAFAEAYADAVSGKNDVSACAGWAVPDSTRDFRRRVTLTFDGGTAWVLSDIESMLRHHRIHGGFAVDGQAVASDPDLAHIAWALANDGHVVFHRGMKGTNLKGVSAKDLEATIKAGDKALADAKIAAPRFFRFPFGAASCEGLRVVRALGKVSVGWHIDSADWCFEKGKGTCRSEDLPGMLDPERSDFIAHVLAELERNQGGIVRLSASMFVRDHLVRLVRSIHAAGFTFTNLDSAFLPGLNPAAEPLPDAAIGDRCMIDDDCPYATSDEAGVCVLVRPYWGGGLRSACSLPCRDTACVADTNGEPTFCAALWSDFAGNGELAAPVDSKVMGRCVSYPSAANDNCLALDGRVPIEAEQYTSDPATPPVKATVCIAPTRENPPVPSRSDY